MNGLRKQKNWLGFAIIACVLFLFPLESSASSDMHINNVSLRIISVILLQCYCLE